MEMESGQQGLEAAGHIMSIVRRKREMNASVRSFSPLYTTRDSHPGNGPVVLRASVSYQLP